ncbi:hypothetical protein ACWD48_06180 [Streptomyces sp. NPDC002519]
MPTQQPTSNGTLTCSWCGHPVPRRRAKWWDGKPQCPNPFRCTDRIFAAQNTPAPTTSNPLGEAMSKTIHAIRLDVDGTLTDLQLPPGAGLVEELRKAVGGRVEIAHYARPEGNRRLSVAADAGGALTKQQNLYATSLVNAIYLKQLPYPLYGPVVLLGALDETHRHTDFPPQLHEVLPKVIAALKQRYKTTV